MTQLEFQEKYDVTMPSLPGIYKYFDKDNDLLYVGKAKNLKKRVSSYFVKNLISYKTKELVSRINSIEFTIVDTEQDALLLEKSLIGKFQPKYNIDLKDDKMYPFIVVKKEPFPRVFLTRKRIKDGSEYIGPFTSVAMVRDVLDFVKQHIKIRNCKLDLSAKKIEQKKYSVCLEYHLGNCAGPCVGLQNLSNYNERLNYLRQIVKGNVQDIIKIYEQEKNNFIETLAFEKAGVIQNKINQLQDYQAKSTIINSRDINVDVFNILEEGNLAFVCLLSVRNGTIVYTQTIQIIKKLDETANEILELVVPKFRLDIESDTNEIVVPFEIEMINPDIIITIPKAGDKKKLLDLAQKNVNYFYYEIKKKKTLHLEKATPESIENVLLEIKNYLNLQNIPLNIECFDNSNFQGSYPVSAMVSFKNGVPSKEDYRKFNVKTVEGINDFASMKEAVYRRYSRLKKENTPLPQLVIIDGGKGQLNAALSAIEELELIGKLTLVGLAKNEEELFFANDKQSIKLPWDSPSLKLIRRIRDEVHRFGITFHRQIRSKGAFNNELENIEGIGKATVVQLLKTFKSLTKIKAAKKEDLEKAIGKSKAKIITDYFSDTNTLNTNI